MVSVKPQLVIQLIVAATFAGCVLGADGPTPTAVTPTPTSPAAPTSTPLLSPLLPTPQQTPEVVPSPSVASSSTINTTKRRVVLHQDHGHKHLPHHHSPWEMEMGLVVVLVMIHFLALCFWMYLLYSTKEKKRAAKKWGLTTKATSTGGALSDSSSASKYSKTAKAASSRGGAPDAASSWRTPGEILATWNKTAEKQRLGKV